MIAPVNLAPIYPYPYPDEITFFNMKYAGSFFLLAAITAFCIATLKRTRVFTAAWLFYLVTLLPVIGIVQVGAQPVADRYAYLPSLGPFILAALGAGTLYGTSPGRARTTAYFAAALLIAGLMSYGTVLQTYVWRNSITLWAHQTRLYPDDVAEAHNSLGKALDNFGRTDEAIEEYLIAIRIRPELTEARYNLALLYHRSGRSEEALREIKNTIWLKSDYANAHNLLGTIYADMGSTQEAIDEFKKTIELNPDHHTAHYNIGRIYEEKGFYANAIIEYTRAVELKPDYPRPHNNLGNIYGSLGLFEKSIEEYRTAIELNPDYLAPYFGLAQSLEETGDTEKAAENYRMYKDKKVPPSGFAGP